ncbi:MAG: hypothetical protein E3J64_08450, partial [Anaerolineales bacterium]
MKDERKTKKQLIEELEDLRDRADRLESGTSRQALEAKPVAELISLMRFTQDVSSQIHGLLDRDKVISVVTEAFRGSKTYLVSIALLTEDGSKLHIAGVSVALKLMRAAEKTAGIRISEHVFALEEASIFDRVVREGETIHAMSADVLGELFPSKVARLATEALGYADKRSILTPLRIRGRIAGVLAMSSTDLAEHLTPSVENLAQHVSAALELADEHAERAEAEITLRHRLEFEDLVLRLSTRFIGVPTGELDQELNSALAEIGTFAGIDRSYIFQIRDDGELMD